MPDTYNIFGTKANNLDAFVGSIPDAQLIIVPDPVTGKLFRSTFGQLKADVILAFGDLSYLDQIIEVPQVANLPQPGEVKKIYVITGAGPDQNKQFRWGGSIYVEFPAGSGDVAGEAIIRGNADANLQSQIDAEITNRQNAYAGLQTNITNEATARSNADTLLSQQISSEKNTRNTNDNILQGLINAEGATRLTADNALSDRIDTKLNIADYNPHFKGKYTTLSVLQTALPTALPGDYAQVDAGEGSNVINYNWDDEEGWVPGSAVGPSIASTDDLTEGSINLYFTAARAQAAVDLSGKVDKVAGKQLSSEDYTTAEKAKLSGIEAGAQVNPLNTDSLPEGSVNLYFNETGVRGTVLTSLSTATGGDIIATDSILAAFGRIQNRFNTYLSSFNGANQLVKLDTSGKLPAIDGSALINLPGGGGGSSLWTASGSNIYYTNGNVGVGTSSPASKVTVEADSLGAEVILSTLDSTGVRIQNTTVATSSATNQISPALVFSSYLWNTTAPAQANLTSFLIFSAQNPDTANQGALYFQARVNGIIRRMITISEYGALSTATISTSNVSTSGLTATGIATLGAVSSNDYNSTRIFTNALSGLWAAFKYTGTINVVSGTGRTFIGFYFNPTLTATVGTSVIGFQNTVGDCLFGTTSGSVGIGATTTIDSSAILQITSTTKGFLQPRMTATDWGSIASKAEGLQGWNNGDHGQMWFDGTRSIGFRYNGTKFQGYDGTSWIDLN